MGTSFAPYVEPLLPIIVKHMQFEHSKAIKKLALKTFTNFLVAIGEPQNILTLQEAFPLYTQSMQ